MINKVKRILKYYISSFRCKSPESPKFKSFLWENGNLSNHYIESYEIPKIIWLYWEGQEIQSPLIKLCIRRIKELNTNYNVILLNEFTVHTYISDMINFPLGIMAAHRSDWIRLKLLEIYGGVYIDGSVLLNENVDWVIELNRHRKSEAVLYYTNVNTKNTNYPMLENWFIGAVKGSSFIRDWRIEFEKCLLSSEYSKYYQKVDFYIVGEIELNMSYYMAYYSAQAILRNSNSFYKLSVVESDYDGFYYSLAVPVLWSDIAISEILLLNKKPEKLPKVVKIISGSRKTLDEYILLKNYKKGSILGDLLTESNFNTYVE